MTWFSRLRNWQTDSTNGIGIRADYHDSEDNNFATGINASLNIGGLNSPTADISWGTNKITGLKPGTLATDACNVSQAQTRVVAYAADSSGTDAYAITLSPAITAYAVGQQFTFAPGTPNTGACSLNVNGLGAKPIKRDYNVDPSDGDLAQNQMITVVYDGTNFQMINAAHGQITQNMSAIYAADGGGSDSYAITLSPAISTYSTGLMINFKANTKNTGAASLNVNALGAKAIKKDGGVDLTDNDITGGQIIQVIYDGTNFQLISPIFGTIGQNGSAVYAADTGSANAYAVALSPAPGSYTTGMVVRFKASFQNSGSATLNVNSLGAKTIVKNISTNLASADIAVGQFVEVIYDGTNFVMLSPITNLAGTVTSVATGSGLSGGTITATGTLTAANGVPLQCVSTTINTRITTSSTTMVDLTGMTVSITPSASTCKVLIFGHIMLGTTTNVQALFQLVRGSTPICLGSGAAGAQTNVTIGAAASNGEASEALSFCYLDSPATTSSTAYKFQWCTSSSTAIVNQTSENLSSLFDSVGTSTITVMEIKA